MPDESPTELGVLQSTNRFRAQFKPTNLAIRSRDRKDLDREAELQLEQRAIHQADNIQKDSRALAAYKTLRTLDFNEETVKERLGREARMVDARIELMRQQTASAAAAAEARIASRLAIEANSLNRDRSTTEFSVEAGKLAAAHPVGTTEYTNGLAQLVAKHPGADKSVVNNLWKFTNSDIPAEEVAKNLTAVKSVVPNATVSASSTGSVSASIPGNENAVRRQITAFENLRARAVGRLEKNQNPEAKQMLTEDVEYYKQQLEGLRGELGGQAAPAGAPAPAQRTPRDEEALAWANSNPGDPRAAQIKSKLGVK